jgi:repressor LexA
MTESRALTPRQREIYDYICVKIEERGYPPSIREIGEAFRIQSPNGVMCHLKALEKKGLMRRQEGRARAIQIDGIRANSGSSLPYLGFVAAGPTLEAVPLNERINLGELFAGKDHYALKVRGQSMIEDHIDEGDIVVIRKQEIAENGEKVVAMVDGGVTLKTLYRRENEIHLQPSNSTMSTIVVDPSRRDVQILGVLVGVIRKC